MWPELRYVEHEFNERKKMLPILALQMLANAFASVVIDKAQTAGKEAIMKAVNENLDDDTKNMLNDAIKSDKAHDKTSLADLLG